MAVKLSKAFDKLVQEMLDIQVEESLAFLIKAYLPDRFQYVDINGSSSSLLPVTSGAP